MIAFHPGNQSNKSAKALVAKKPDVIRNNSQLWFTDNYEAYSKAQSNGEASITTKQKYFGKPRNDNWNLAFPKNPNASGKKKSFW